MEVPDFFNSANFVSQSADSVSADIRVESKKFQLVVRLFKPKRHIRADHAPLSDKLFSVPLNLRSLMV